MFDTGYQRVDLLHGVTAPLPGQRAGVEAELLHFEWSPGKRFMLSEIGNDKCSWDILEASEGDMG